MILLTLLALLLPADTPKPPAEIIVYQVTETVRARTPAGERETALVGTMSMAGDKARWEISAGTFPHLTASVALSDEGRVSLLDRREKIVAETTPAEFQTLLAGKGASDSGPASFATRAVSASVSGEGAGKAFQSLRTERFRVKVGWTLAVSIPGRVGQVKSEISGTIETLSPDVDGPRSSFDDLTRLFAAPAAVMETLEPELAKIRGLPVSVALEMTSEMTGEPVAMPGGGLGGPESPLRSTRVIKRVVSGLTWRPFAAPDRELFAVPEDYRSRGLDRLVRDIGTLR